MAERAKRTRAGRRQIEDGVLALWEAGMLDVAAAVLEQAKGGDVRSQQEIIQRVLGKAQERRGDDDAGAATLRIIIEEPPDEEGEQEAGTGNKV